MRTVDEPAVFPPANCGACRSLPWTKWCRPCNGVFCDAHIDRKLHTCRPDEERPQAQQVVQETAEPAAPPDNNGSSVSVQMPMQLEIFTTPPPSDQP